MSKATIRDVFVYRETDKAILVKDGDDGPNGFSEWIPKSQIHDDSDLWKEGQDGDLVVKSWLAEQKGWELD